MLPNSKHEQIGHGLSHGTHALKHAVKVLGSRVIDQRTTVGKALAEIRAEIVNDLGGAENLSRAEHLLVEEAIITTLLLSSVNAWLLQQPSIVSNKTRGVLAAARDRATMVNTLQSLLTTLGLKRRTREITLGDWLASKSDGNGSATESSVEPPASHAAAEDA
jgi:hypothetical protein